MTPKEKAIELVETYKKIDAIYNTAELGNNVFAIDCAIIAVDEIISEYDDIFLKCYDNDLMMWEKDQRWWEQVKKEINEL